MVPVFAQDEPMKLKKERNYRIELGIKYGFNGSNLIITPLPDAIFFHSGFSLDNCLSLTIGKWNRIGSIMIDIGVQRNRNSFSFNTDSSVIYYRHDFQYFRASIYYKPVFYLGNYMNKRRNEGYFIVGMQFNSIIDAILYYEESLYTYFLGERVNNLITPINIMLSCGGGINIPLSQNLLILSEVRLAFDINDINNGLYPGFSLHQLSYNGYIGLNYLLTKKQKI